MHDFTRSTSHPLMILQKKCSNQACKLRLVDEEDLKGMKWIDSESESNKTGFKGGWEISSPDSKNIQDTEDDQDALLKKGAFVE